MVPVRRYESYWRIGLACGGLGLGLGFHVHQASAQRVRRPEVFDSYSNCKASEPEYDAAGQFEPTWSCHYRQVVPDTASNQSETKETVSKPKTFISRALVGTLGWIATTTRDPINIFTLLLVFVSALQWRAIKRQGDLAERAIVDIERPYIFVTGGGRIENQEIESAEYPATFYDLFNHGRTPAIIEGIYVVFDWGHAKPPIRTDADFNDVVDPIVAAGDRRLRVEVTNAGLEHTLNGRYDGEVGQYFDYWVPRPDEAERPPFLYLHIIVAYRGPFTRRHETSACWRYDRRYDELKGWGGSEYNYVS